MEKRYDFLTSRKITAILLFTCVFIGIFNGQIGKSNAEVVTPPTSGNWIIYYEQNYTVNSDFELVGNIDLRGNLTIENCKITIKDNSYTIFTKYNANLTMNNVTIEGLDSASGTNYGGLKIDHSGNNLVIENCTFKNMRTQMINPHKFFSITDSIFDGTTQDIIKFTDLDINTVQDCLIRNCSFKNAPNRYAIYFIKNLGGASYQNLTIENNTFSNLGGIYLDKVHQLNLSYNTFDDIDGKVLETHGVNNFNITNNQINQSGNCFNLIDSWDGNVKNNDFNKISGIAMEFQWFDNINLTRNDIDLIDSGAIAIKSYRDWSYKPLRIDQTNITHTNFTSDRFRVFDFGLGGAPYHNVRITNNTQINGLNITSYFNLENTTEDIGILTSGPFSQIIIMNCENTTFVRGNINFNHGYILDKVFNCFHNSPRLLVNHFNYRHMGMSCVIARI